MIEHPCRFTDFAGKKYGSVTKVGLLNCITLIDLVLQNCCHYTGAPVSLDEAGHAKKVEDWFTEDSVPYLLNRLDERCVQIPSPSKARHGDIVLTKRFAGRRMLLIMANNDTFFYLFEKEYVGVDYITTPFWSKRLESFWRLRDY